MPKWHLSQWVYKGEKFSIPTLDIHQSYGKIICLPEWESEQYNFGGTDQKKMALCKKKRVLLILKETISPGPKIFQNDRCNYHGQVFLFVCFA